MKYIFKEYINMTSVNPVHNAPCLSMTGLDVQANRARREGWGGKGLLQTDSARFFAHCFIGLSLPPPPKPPSQTERLTELIYINMIYEIVSNPRPNMHRFLDLGPNMHEL
jgi:hypothetical protein